jgi:DNA-binding XRE family transcriptional regulator/predicted RNA-binding Zn-ribbon protein involved in translation (DUF1610 family)
MKKGTAMATKQKCPVCGAGDVTVTKPSEYKYDNCGLSGVVLLGEGVTIFDCGQCGNRATLIHNEVQLSQIIGMTILMNTKSLSGEEVRYLRTLCGMTQKEISEMINMRRPTVSDWERRGTKKAFSLGIEEIGFRLFFFRMFSEKVIESEYCALSPKQIGHFSKFVSEIVEKVEAFLGGRGVQTKITVCRHGRSKNWSPEETVAA